MPSPSETRNYPSERARRLADNIEGPNVPFSGRSADNFSVAGPLRKKQPATAERVTIMSGLPDKAS